MNSKELESELLGVWTEIFGANVQVDSDFLSLGGTSLMAMRMVGLVTESLKLPLSVTEIFQHTTFSSLLSALQHKTLQPVPRYPHSTGPLLSFAQRRFWILDQLLSKSEIYNVPAYLDVCGQVDLGRLQISLDKLIDRHPSLAICFPAVLANPVAVPCRRQVRVDTLDCPLSEREQLAFKIAYQPFRLESGPLWRFTVLRHADERSTLLVSFHHSIVDAAAIELFWQGKPASYSI
jgi:fengycin family lipopeptide synthetase B